MSLDRRSSSGTALPGTIRAVVPHPSGGRVVMSGFPGLEIGIDGEAAFLPEACRETLQGMKDLGATGLTLLVESDELDAGFLDGVDRLAKDVGLTLARFPITDYSVPSAAAKAAWEEAQNLRGEILQGGGTIAYACQYGAGRSGLMAAWLLIEGGVMPEDAIATVRSHFAEAVESEAQENWLRALQ